MATQSILSCVTESGEGASLLACPQDLTRGREARLLSLALPMIKRNGLVLDLSRVQSIDASGVGLLVFLRQCADRSGTQLVLVNPSARVREMLALVHLNQILLSN